MSLKAKIVSVNFAMAIAFILMVLGVIWGADDHTTASCLAALCVMTWIIGFRYIDLAQRERS